MLLARSMDRVLLLGLTARVTRESLLMVICMAMDRLEVAKVSTLAPLKKDSRLAVLIQRQNSGHMQASIETG